MSYKDLFADAGLQVPRLFLPAEGIPVEKWATVACDQFSSEPDYWQRCEDNTKGVKSTLDLIYPEAYYHKDKDKSIRISSIQRKMKEWLEDGTLKELEEGVMYIRRSTPYVKNRDGLIIAIDLEAYDYRPGADALIRPTEGTILERIPPRMQIREDAVLDLTHVLMLIDDPENNLFNVLKKAADEKSPEYTSVLMENGGELSGTLISDEGTLTEIGRIFAELKSKNEMLFAVGDGNHSLATAKTVWEKLKEEGAPADHPARYALVEIENIHDKGMVFEPIHRVLFDCDPRDVLEYAVSTGSWKIADESSDSMSVPFFYGTEKGILVNTETSDKLLVERLQKMLDNYMDQRKDIEIDFIHGEDSVKELTSVENRIGFLLPALDKKTFFDLILKIGTLPRKAFSIGEAVEKRYYLEVRKLR